MLFLATQSNLFMISMIHNHHSMMEMAKTLEYLSQRNRKSNLRLSSSFVVSAWSIAGCSSFYLFAQFEEFSQGFTVKP
jgi:hypothetical protein